MAAGMMPLSVARRRAVGEEPGIDRSYLSEALDELVPAPPPGGFSESQYNPPAAPTPSEQKAAARAARDDHAITVAQGARTNPAGGMQQGAASAAVRPYQGTGTTKSNTGVTGGVTTGEPGKGHIRVSVPGRGMVDYDPADASIAESFGGRDSFMMHTDRGSAPPQTADSARRLPWMKTGAPALGGGSVETLSEVPEASQLENYHRYLRGRDAEQQAFDTSMAESSAREARARVQSEDPFYAEELQAKSKIGEEAIKAQLEQASRGQVIKITDQAAQKINKLNANPADPGLTNEERMDAIRHQKLTPAERKRVEDMIWDQARLTLSGFTKTNLYEHPDPYRALMGITPPPTQK